MGLPWTPEEPNLDNTWGSSTPVTRSTTSPNPQRPKRVKDTLRDKVDSLLGGQDEQQQQMYANVGDITTGPTMETQGREGFVAPGV